MTGPSIKVSADIGDLSKKVEEVSRRVDELQNGFDFGEAKLDTTQVERKLKDVQAQAKAVQNSVQGGSGGPPSGSSGLSYTPVSAPYPRAPFISPNQQRARQLEERDSKLLRAKEELNKLGVRLTNEQTAQAKSTYDLVRKSKMRGTRHIKDMEFDQLLAGGWRGFAVNEKDAFREFRQILSRSGIEIPGGGSGGGGASSGETGQSKRSFRFGGASAGALGGIAAGMLGGGDGGLWQSVGSATGAGLGAGAGMLFGGPVGAAVGAFAGRLLGGFGGSMDSSIGKIGDEGATYSDLRQSIGATTTDFDSLRGSVRVFTDGLGVAYNESARLAAEFARTASLSSASGLGQDVRTSIGFGRSYGINPSESVRFFGGMRHLGVTGDDKDSRRLALLIAEAVNGGGMQARMGEALSAIQAYASSQARSSLSSPDVGAYSSFLSSMTGLGAYGLKGDPAAAAAIMGKADASLRNGGAFGEASQNLSLALWQSKIPGFTAFDMDFVNEQGAFGSIGKAFGRDSQAYKFAASRGDSAKMSAYDSMAMAGGDRSILSMQMQMLEEKFGGSTDSFRKAIQGHFGVGASEAASLYQAYQTDKGLGGLESALVRSGVDTKGMNPRQIASLAALANGDSSAITKQANALMRLQGRDALNVSERGELEAARNDPNKLRDTVLQLTAKHATFTDQGDQLRSMSTDMGNILQELATKLVPLTMDIKNAIMEVVRKFNPDSPWLKAEDEKNQKLANDKAEAGRLDREIKEVSDKIENFTPFSQEEQSKKAAQIASLHSARSSALVAGDKERAATYDSAIEQLSNSMRYGYGLDELKQQRADLVSRRNAIESQPAAYAQYDDAVPNGDKGNGQFSGKADFLQKTREAAQSAADEINRRTGSAVTPEMIQAQWGMETGWGKKMTGAFNYGNIKAGRGWAGKTQAIGGVLEYGPDGQKTYGTENFRAYGSAQEAGADYAGMISNRFLKGKPVKSADEFYRALKAQGYATDPDYAGKLLSAYRGIPELPDNQLPASAAKPSSQAVDVRVQLNADPIRLVDASGLPMGQSLPLNSNVKVGQPYGGTH